jgi:exonuclease VII large subunit
MRILASLVLISTLPVVAQQQQGEIVPPISAAEAATNLNRSVVVTGKVAQVSIREKLVYLNLDKPFPNMPLSCVIFAKNTNQFPLAVLKDKPVQITGKVTEHNGKPQIVLTSTNQLKVVEVAK